MAPTIFPADRSGRRTIFFSARYLLKNRRLLRNAFPPPNTRISEETGAFYQNTQKKAMELLPYEKSYCFPFSLCHPPTNELTTRTTQEQPSWGKTITRKIEGRDSKHFYDTYRFALLRLLSVSKISKPRVHIIPHLNGNVGTVLSSY